MRFYHSIRRASLTLIAFLSCSAAFAQTAVKGRVVDADNAPLPFASVIVSGTSTGTMTDDNGYFSIPASKGQTLEISFIGFATSNVQVGASADLGVITLEADSKFLEEVVVVGYDTQKKVNLTGSVSSMSSDALENRPIIQASTALQGMMPGVTVTTRGGAPGDDAANIRIRGLGTFGTSSAAPLVLIDGIEGDMNTVDASQIDKISVLKDAASSAIYGSRAANGVILITTKRAGKERSSVSYRGYVGWQTPTDLPALVNAREYMILSREASENDGATSIYTDEYIENYMVNNYLDPDNYPITNWQKEVLQGNGLMHGHNLTINASSGNIRNVTTFGYLKQNGIIKNTDYSRYSLRNNMDVELNKKLSFRLDIAGNFGQRNYIPSQSAIFMFMNARDPLMLARWSDGNYAPFTGGSTNILPYLDGDGGFTKVNSLNLTGSASLTYKPFDWWTIEGKFSPRLVLRRTIAFQDIVTYYSDPYGTESTVHNVSYNELNETVNSYYYGNYQATTSFQKKFGSGHYAKLLLGTSYETMDNRNVSGHRQNFDYPQYPVLSAGRADETMSTDGTRYQWALLSYFGRVNYNYKERYLLEANIRFDGSSRFAKGHRWGIFPSVSAAWRISEENWMKNAKNILTEMKIRASYGQLGNQSIGSDYYPTIQALTISNISANGILYPILATNTLANQDITWETSTMYDIGIDAAFLNKISLTADAYYKTTDGILLKLTIPDSIGLGEPYQNAGVVRNIGWELGIGYHDVFGDWSWGIDANVSDVYNKIIDMKGTTGGSGVIRNQEGSSINSLYGLKCIGMARTQEDADWINENCPQYGAKTMPGDLVYEDYDNNGIIDDNDRQIIGSAIPRYTYGATLSAGWKGIGLSVQLQGVGKANTYVNSYYTQPCQQGGTFRKEHLDRWTPETPDGKFPRMSWANVNNTKTSSFWMADASYLRIKNVQLSYTLPSKILKKARISNVTFFANATNLLTFTNYYQGYDPENTFTNSGDGVTTGAVANNYPLVKSYTFGIDIKF